MKIILKDFMRLIPGIGENEIGFLNEKSASRKVYIIRGSIMKLLNDESFYLTAMENGLLNEFKDWFNNLTTRRSPKISDNFIKGETDWTPLQLLSLWVVAGSQDQFNELLPDKQVSLEKLIEHSVGGSANNAVKKFRKSEHQQIGLKREIVEISPRDNEKINEVHGELNSRAELLIDWINEKNGQENRNINFGSLWEKAFDGCVQEVSYQQLQDWKDLSKNEIRRVLFHAVRPVPPLEERFIGIEGDKIGGLLTDIQRSVEEIGSNKGLIDYLKPTPAIQVEAELKEAAAKLEKIVKIMSEL